LCSPDQAALPLRHSRRFGSGTPSTPTIKNATANFRSLHPMSFNHTVVWLDHSEAHVLNFSAEESEGKHIHSQSKHKNLHSKSGIAGSGHTPENQSYYHEVMLAIAEAKEILVVGPSSAKLFLIKHLEKHNRVIAANVVGVETVDHPSDGQLLSYARQYFVAADRMRGDGVMGAKA